MRMLRREIWRVWKRLASSERLCTFHLCSVNGWPLSYSHASFYPPTFSDSRGSRESRLRSDGSGHHAGRLHSGQGRTAAAHTRDDWTAEAWEGFYSRYLYTHMRIYIVCFHNSHCALNSKNWYRLENIYIHAQSHKFILKYLNYAFAVLLDAINLCLNLITQGQEDVAFSILRTFPALNSNGESNMGNFFLKHCINMDTVH